MKLFLRVAVYNGGGFWRECWESIKENLDILDGVYISVNYSESQKQDIELIKSCPSSKVKWRKENEYLSSVAHCVNIDNWLLNFDLDGHILILCHDDILERKGLRKLKELELKQDEAVWLGASFFYEKNMLGLQEKYQDIYSDEKISSEEFFRTFHKRTLNVSRILIPFSAYRMQTCPWRLLGHGYGAEVTYLCNPCVNYIQQMREIGIKIRQHADSEGARKTEAVLFDAIFVQLHTCLMYSQEKTRILIARHLFYFYRKYPLKSITVFFSVQKKLHRLEHYSLKKIILTLICIPIVPFVYIFDRIGRIMKKLCRL